LTARTTSFRVRIEDLIAAIEKRREELVAAHEKAVAAHADEVRSYATKTAAMLRKAADDLEAGRKNPLFGGSCCAASKALGYPPVKPQAKPDTTRIDRTLKTLRMASEPTISIRTDDELASYL